MGTSKTKNISKAYKFLLMKGSDGGFFSVKEMAQSIGWKESTIKTYMNKQWRKIIKKTEKGYTCPGISNISEAEFLKMNSQKDKFEVPHLRGDNVLAYKARNFALLAVATYNNPFSEFRIYGHIVHMIIAWTSLFHAIFQREKTSFFYIDNTTQMPKKKDGEDMVWELGRCIDEYWKNTNNPIKSNLEFLIGLRNKLLLLTIHLLCLNLLLSAHKKVSVKPEVDQT